MHCCLLQCLVCKHHWGAPKSQILHAALYYLAFNSCSHCFSFVAFCRRLFSGFCVLNFKFDSDVLMAIPLFVIIVWEWYISRCSMGAWSLCLGCDNTHQMTCRKFLSCRGNPHVSRSDLCLAAITFFHCDEGLHGETGSGRWVKHVQC